MYRHICQEVCPYNIKFAQELKEPAFAPREILAGKDVPTLAEDILALSQNEFSASFRKSPMKRAKLAGLQRNALVVLENIDSLSQSRGAVSAMKSGRRRNVTSAGS